MEGEGQVQVTGPAQTRPPPIPPLRLPLEHSKLSFVGAGETRNEERSPTGAQTLELGRPSADPGLCFCPQGSLHVDNDPGKLERDPSSSVVMVTRQGDNFL